MKNKTRAWLFHSRPTYFRLCAIVIGLEYHSAGPERMIWHQFSTWFCPWPSFLPSDSIFALKHQTEPSFYPCSSPLPLFLPLDRTRTFREFDPCLPSLFPFPLEWEHSPYFCPYFCPLALVFSLRLSFSLQIRKGGDWWTPRIEVLFALISPLISTLSPFFSPFVLSLCPHIGKWRDSDGSLFALIYTLIFTLSTCFLP